MDQISHRYREMLRDRSLTRSEMALAPIRFHIIIIIIFFSFTRCMPRLHNATQTVTVLPLFHSSPNSSRTSSTSLRHFQIHPNARMKLYDDLLLNGYYTTRLWIGTPPQEFALIVDTGSTVTYVPCSSCDQCGTHQDPKFQPELSSTYQPVKCNIDCNCDHESGLCVYERQYAEMSTSSGVLANDVISFGNESTLVPQSVVFGCENMETGDLYSQHADGIMGLGRGDLSIVDQLVEKGVISDSFSLCYGGMDVGGGAMLLGSIDPPSGMVFTDSDPERSPYYNIDLKEIHVAGKPLSLNPGVFDGKHGTVLDSGTTYAYLPEAAFAAFMEAIMKELSSLKQIPGPDPNYNDICFSVSGSNVSHAQSIFPAVDLIFGNREKLSLSPDNYLFRHSKVSGAYCLGIFQNGKDPTTLLGGIIVRDTLVLYDRENSKVGFWKTNCSELWEGLLHMASASPPNTSPSDETNFTNVLPPEMAPSDHLLYVLPVREVGQITFEMSLSANFSDLKLHITELTEYLAQELGISNSQVRLLNLTSKEYELIIEWAIIPPKSANTIANDTVLGIISRVAEHHMRLPDKFGSYELIHWEVVSQKKRTWRQQYQLTLIIVIVIVLFIGLSAAAGIWLMWRRRLAAANAYRPVNAAVPEQELQPLKI